MKRRTLKKRSHFYEQQGHLSVNRRKGSHLRWLRESNPLVKLWQTQIDAAMAKWGKTLDVYRFGTGSKLTVAEPDE